MKKLFLFTLIFLCFAFSSINAQYVKGDLDGDGKITMVDVMELAMFKITADLNCDSVVSIEDALILYSYIFRGIDSLSYCEDRISFPYLIGDADGNGRINIADVSVIVKNIFFAGDLDCNGKVDEVDVKILADCIFVSECNFCE